MTANNPSSFFSDAPEKAYQTGADRALVRQLGQFFTPYPIARFMARWIAAGNPQTVLDPAVGLGVLLRAVRQEATRPVALTGYDIDAKVLKQARQLWREDSINLKKRDFLKDGWGRRYDAIVCNPPYLHFRGYENRTELLAGIQARLGLRLGGQTNLLSFFLLKGLSQLSARGRAAYILPPEFLNADYGVALKRYLLEQKSLKQVIVFDASEPLFDQGLTTTCILLFDKADPEPSVTFRRVLTLAALEGPLGTNHKVPYTALDPAVKWRRYYQPRGQSHPVNRVPLSTYGKVVRGIATGHNRFFTINEEKREQFGLGEQYLLPCLTRAAQARAAFFTRQQWAGLRAAGKAVYLLNVDGVQDSAARQYIAWGEQQGAHQRYLTRHRQPWYQIEQRPPAPILVTVFNRTGLRFIRNEAKVRNLTCFHGLYLNPLGRKNADLLMAYLLTPVARAIFKDSGREYGEGLEKFEPNDLNNASVLNLQAVSPTVEIEIESIYRAYRAGVRRNKPDPLLLDRLDQIFSKLLD